MPRTGGQGPDVPNDLTVSVVASLIAGWIASADPTAFPGGTTLKWSLVGLAAGYFGVRLLVAQTGRPRMIGVAAFTTGGAYLLLRSTLLPPPGIPIALQVANAVTAAAVLALAAYLALRWDRRGRHRGRGTALG